MKGVFLEQRELLISLFLDCFRQSVVNAPRNPWKRENESLLVGVALPPGAKACFERGVLSGRDVRFDPFSPGCATSARRKILPHRTPPRLLPHLFIPIGELLASGFGEMDSRALDGFQGHTTTKPRQKLPRKRKSPRHPRHQFQSLLPAPNPTLQ